MSKTDYRLLIISDSAEAEGAVLPIANAMPAAVTTSEADQALTTIDAEKPDAVIVFGRSESWLLSVIQGLLSRNGADLPPVIVVTDDNKVSLLGCLEAGAADYLYCREAEVQLLDTVVRRQIAALGLARTIRLRKIERDQESGFRVQQSMLPESPASLSGLRFQHKLYPKMIMSGDFVDYFELVDGRVAFYIADVSGHGASGAFVTIMLKTLSRRLIEEGADMTESGEMLEWFNRELMQWQLEQHVTMFLGVIDVQEHELQYSNAAQFPGAIFSDADSTEFMKIGGQPLGLVPEPNYPSHKLNLPESYSIAMFSDGVFEIMGETSLVDKEARLLSMVKSHDHDAEPQVVVEELGDELAAALGLASIERVPDDIAIFTVTSETANTAANMTVRAGSKQA